MRREGGERLERAGEAGRTRPQDRGHLAEHGAVGVDDEQGLAGRGRAGVAGRAAGASVIGSPFRSLELRRISFRWWRRRRSISGVLNSE
jgi:hypothetical protein